MGSGNRISFRKLDGYGFGIFASRFPFRLTIHVTVLCWGLSIGFGKGYDHA